MSQIPGGKVTTYKTLAQACNPKAYRAIGHICKRNPHAPHIPCYRVIKSNGELGGYAFGIQKKTQLLQKEGIKMVKGKIKLIKYHYTFL
ncbi:MGMT family protein [Candidatus Pacearchaeota archaeon]|nr:MGMT family protein [Candidatus Pacearchaeota archaeon]